MRYWPALTTVVFCTLAASAQSSKLALPDSALAPTNASLPDFDAARVTFRETGDLDLGQGQGRLDITQFEVRSVLSRPIPLANDWLVVPLAEFTQTTLSVQGAPTASPFHDDDLYSIGLSAFAVHMSQSSPWLYGAWGRAELASDFNHVTSDAFTFDVAAGGGYRFNDAFILGFGVAAFNLNGNLTCYPALAFDWIVNDALRVGLYGPTFVTAYTYSPDWLFSFRAKAGGGIWNVTDAAGNSRAIDLTTYQIGVFADRHLFDKLWLSAGVGLTVGNTLDYTTPHGDTLFERAPEAGVFGQIGLRLRAW